MFVMICADNAADKNWIKVSLNNCFDFGDSGLVVEEFSSGAELLFRIEDVFGQVDLVFLDVIMPNENGYIVAGKLRGLGYIGDIVFMCEQIDYVLAAFDYDALNYLIKGKTDDKRFVKIIEKSIRKATDRNKQVIVLSCAGETRAVAISDIKYFEIIKRIVTVHYGNESFEFYSTMSKLEEQLSGNGFIRTHKSFLVNSKYISKITSRSLHLVDGNVLPAGQRYVKNLKDSEY